MGEWIPDRYTLNKGLGEGWAEMLGRYKGVHSALKTQFITGAMRITLKIRLTLECWFFLMPSFPHSPTLFILKLFHFSLSVTSSSLNLFPFDNLWNFASVSLLGLTYFPVPPGWSLYLSTTVLTTLLCKSFVIDFEFFERKGHHVCVIYKKNSVSTFWMNGCIDLY